MMMMMNECFNIYSTDDDYAKIVLSDLRGTISGVGSAALNADIERWRTTLISVKQDVERQLSQGRSDSIIDGSTVTRQEYEEWKHRAVGFKQIVERKLRTVKAIQKESGQEEHNKFQDVRNGILMEIRDELKDINTRLLKNGNFSL